MKLTKTKYIGVALSIVAITVSSFAIVFANRNKIIRPSKASTYSMVLNSSTTTHLTNEFGNDTFSVSTNSGQAAVSWEVAYGKTLDGGLVSLGKTTHGNNNGENFYITNTSPITSITNVSVSIGADQTLVLFGSNNGVSFYKIDFLTATNNSSSLASKYQYLKFANASQALNEDLDIQSISIEYNCSINDYTDEISDITSNEILKDDDSALSLDTDYYVSGMNSKNSLKIAKSDVSQYDSIISLNGLSIPSNELQNYSLTFYADGTHNANQSGKKYCHIWIYPATGTTRNQNGGYFQASVNNGTSWVQCSVDLSSPTGGSFKDTETYNSFYIRIKYLNGYVNIDQMRISYKPSYPTYIPTLDNNDLAIASNIVLPPSKNGDAYAAEDSEDITYNDGALSVSCSSIKFTAAKVVGWSTTSVSLGGTYNVVDDATKVIEFYIYFGHAKGNESSASTGLKIALAHPKDNYSHYETSQKSSHVAGVGMTSLGNGWYKYSYEVSEFGNLSSDTTDFSYIYLQLASSGITQSDIDAGVYFVIDRLSIA